MNDAISEPATIKPIGRRFPDDDGSLADDLLAEEVIMEVGEQLFHLVDEQGETKLVISFRDVRFMSSAMVGQSINVDGGAAFF